MPVPTEALTEETQQTGGNEKAEDDAKKETDEKLKEIEAIGKKTGDSVVKDLIRLVTEVKPEVPEVAAKA